MCPFNIFFHGVAWWAAEVFPTKHRSPTNQPPTGPQPPHHRPSTTPPPPTQSTTPNDSHHLTTISTLAACSELVKTELESLGLDTVYVPLEIKIEDSKWNGVARKYWQRDVYYLPICIKRDSLPPGIVWAADGGADVVRDAAGHPTNVVAVQVAGGTCDVCGAAVAPGAAVAECAACQWWACADCAAGLRLKQHSAGSGAAAEAPL